MKANPYRFGGFFWFKAYGITFGPYLTEEVSLKLLLGLIKERDGTNVIPFKRREDAKEVQHEPEQG